MQVTKCPHLPDLTLHILWCHLMSVTNAPGCMCNAACINASAEGWDPDRWDSLDIIQASGQVIRTEMGSSARSGSAAPAEVQQQDDKVRLLACILQCQLSQR